MSYRAVVNVIRDTANAVNPTGTFTHGRRSDASLEFDGTFPQIHLFPFVGDVDKTNAYTESYSIQMLFCGQDTSDSSNEEREDIIAAMDVLSREFINTLFDTDGVTMIRIRTEPNYRILSGTTSGYIVSFTLQVATSPC